MNHWKYLGIGLGLRVEGFHDSLEIAPSFYIMFCLLLGRFQEICVITVFISIP